MPRGRPRKSGATAAAADEPAPKKAKVEVDGSVWRWEWEDQAIKKWFQYSREVSDALCNAVTNSQPEVLLDIGSGMVMRVLLEKMVQKNKVTGWEKRIRCCRKDGDDYFVWEWEDEHNNWNAYSVEHQMALWDAKGDVVTLSVAGRNYDVDKSNLTQKNTDTGVTRTVRKAQSDGSLDSFVAGKTKILPVPDTTAAPAAAAATAKSGRGRRAKSGAGDVTVKKEDEEEEEEKPKPKTKSGAKSGRREREAVRTVVVKGSAPVDPECTAKVGIAHVYTEGKDIYDVMLNQTNVQNNNNKFFIIQLLEDDAKKSYSVWFRWGRVGYPGQNNLVPCGPSLEDAKNTFARKFADKTKNEWADRKSFQKVAGKYDMLEIDYGKNDVAKMKDATDGDPSKTPSIPPSKLEQRLQDLINLICDVKTMEDVVMEMKYDARKAPLGKLTSQQIKAGYSALKKIEACINKKDFGHKLTDACNDFYTRIPHDFGFQVPPIIRTTQEVKAKSSLLEALADIEVAMKLLKQGSSDENPIDSHYKSLECNLEALDSGDSDFKLIEDYVKNTHATTHNQYKMKVLDVFATKKTKMEKNFKDYGNRMLLWHGSRLSNWMGILSQGLRIAPPEAPVTGYMFGKGVYFADMSSKSANYCYANRSKNVGLLLLCEVSLGTTNELLAADYEADKLPKGKHSVKGMGKTAPDPTNNFTMPDGVVVPLGKGKDTGVKNNSLFYNEFIVYNTQQVKMRYLVKVQFDFR